MASGGLEGWRGLQADSEVLECLVRIRDCPGLEARDVGLYCHELASKEQDPLHEAMLQICIMWCVEKDCDWEVWSGGYAISHITKFN